ncbi:MAG: metal ABC transporter ATP-binding protein [Geodermatophilaceae bacterium]
MIDRVVDVKAVSADLGGRRILHEVDLQVATGEVVTLLGANGSGKSTLVRGVVGLVPLSGGTVELFGTPLPRFREWGRIGYVPQRVTAASGVPATVREVVAAGRLSGRGVLARFGAADRTAVDDALDVVGLRPLGRTGVAKLSGGQQQRVLIARALAGRPDLLILDEPMSGVDADSQLAIAAALEQMVAGGTSVLLVLHELGQLAALIDRSVVLGDGRVTYTGSEPPAPGDHRDADHDFLPPPAGGFGLSSSPFGVRQ